MSLTAIVVIAIAFVMLFAAVWLWRPCHRSPPDPIRMVRSSQPLANRDGRIGYLRKLPLSPITQMTFQEALVSEKFAIAIEGYYRDALGLLMSGDGINVAVQAFSLDKGGLELTYSFSDQATALYKQGKAIIPRHRSTGQMLPWMADQKGTIIEQAKHSPELAARLAQAWALIVSVAHVVSAFDIARRLEGVERTLITLQANRRIEQDAKLMRVYTVARGILNRQQQITPEDIAELKHLRHDLFELRQVWRGEIEEVIANAPHPREWRLVKPSSWSRTKREIKSVSSVVACADGLQRVRVAFFTDMCIAESSGTMDDFLGNIVPDEFLLWQAIRDKMQMRRGALRKPDSREVASAFSSAIEGFTELLSALTGAEATDGETLIVSK